MYSVRTVTAPEAADLVVDGTTITVSSSSEMGCPDAVLAAIGERSRCAGHPQNITSIHPIATGDMHGIKGIDHLTQPGLLVRVIIGPYPSGPSSTVPPLTWQMISDNVISTWSLPPGVLFDVHREVAVHRPGVPTQTGMDTYVDPLLQGSTMNEEVAQQSPIERVRFANDDWLLFPNIVPQVAIIRAATADERSNLTYEHEGAHLGPLEQATAVRSNNGVMIAQVKRQIAVGSLKPREVRVPGVLVDYIVVVSEQTQTTQAQYEPAISGEISRPLSALRYIEHGPARATVQ